MLSIYTFFLWLNGPERASTASLLMFLDHEQLDTHTHTHPVGRSEGVISSSQKPLPKQNTTNTRDEHPVPQRDSNPRSQQ
jgi:hypothetical protein